LSSNSSCEGYWTSETPPQGEGGSYATKDIGAGYADLTSLARD
jgi:hypothetical protein